MTNLNKDQQYLLASVGSARDEAKEATEEAYERYLKAKWDAEQGLRKAVKAAIAGKVPIRKIGFVIGSSDHKTVKNLAENADRTFSTRL